jgi:hypothetical protein
MKQVSTTINTLVRSFSSISPRRLFSKYRLVLMLAAIAMLIGGCKKADNDCKKSVSFNGDFQTKDSPISPTHSQITGRGNLTHLGKCTSVAEVYEDNFPSIYGTQTITVANGDEMFTTFTGSIDGPDSKGVVLITNQNIITGGTGKLAGATGNFTQHAIAYTYTPIGTATFDGTIILDECHGKLAVH